MHRPFVLAASILALTLVPSFAAPTSSVLAFATHATGDVAAEPTIGVRPDGTILVEATTRVLASHDDGVTWTLAFAPPTNESLDPYLHVDAATGTAFTSQLLGACQQIFLSSDATSWTPTAQCVPVDHQKIGSGPWVADGLPHVAPSLVYTCSNQIADTDCSTSYDGGLTWNPQTPVFAGVDPAATNGISVTGECGGLEGDPVSGPDGTVYVPREYCGRPFLAQSHDDGRTWSSEWVAQPAQTRPIGYGANNPAVSVDSDGAIYYAFTGADWRHYVARSTDGGASWNGPWAISAAGSSATFPLVLAGSAGRVATAWVGTPDTTLGPDDAPATARWYLYAAVSTDATSATPTWQVVQITPMPMQIGCIGRHGSVCGNNGNLLDFNGIAALADGRVAISYTDGCTPCATQNDSTGTAGYVAVQSGGAGLR